MGAIMKEDDCYIGGLLELLNVRFGLAEQISETSGGIREMVVLQKEFRVFEEGRALRDCFALLNLGGFWNERTKERWYQLIDGLRANASDREGMNGHDRLMRIFIENLDSDSPLPMYFIAHDARGQDGKILRAGPQDRGPFYVTSKHIVVSIPMLPRRQQKAAARKPNKTR